MYNNCYYLWIESIDTISGGSYRDTITSINFMDAILKPKMATLGFGKSLKSICKMGIVGTCTTRDDKI